MKFNNWKFLKATITELLMNNQDNQDIKDILTFLLDYMCYLGDD